MTHIVSHTPLWKEVPGYDGVYLVSDQGGVMSVGRTNRKTRDLILKPEFNKAGNI